jgi:competence protein ComEC
LAACLLWPLPPRNELHVIDVGQGDAILLTTAAGHSMLVDGGPDESLLSDLGRDLNGNRLDLMVITHYDADHVSGFPAVLKNYQVQEIWLPPVEPTTEIGHKVKQLAVAEGALIRTPVVGDTLQLDDFHITVLAPDFSQPASPDTPTNDLAYVLGVSLGTTDILLSSDAPKERLEQAWTAWNLDSPLEVLKVGHHGSKTSTDLNLLQMLRPQQSIISVGAHNRYHHPAVDTLQVLDYLHIPIWRTDEQGSADLFIYPNGHTAPDHRLPGILAVLHDLVCGVLY